MSAVSFQFEQNIGSLSEADRLLFYELFAHNLTVEIRGVWSDTALTDAKKVDRMKWINEILHRITAKTQELRLGGCWPEADIADMMEGWIAQNPAIRWNIQAAVRCSFDAVK